MFTTMFDEETNRSFTYDDRSHHTQNEWVASGELWNPEVEVTRCFKEILFLFHYLFSSDFSNSENKKIL